MYIIIQGDFLFLLYLCYVGEGCLFFKTGKPDEIETKLCRNSQGFCFVDYVYVHTVHVQVYMYAQ